MSCKITKFKLNDQYTEHSCDNFYDFSSGYKSHIKKDEIISIWRKKGYILMDTAIEVRNRMLYMTTIEGVADTIEFINFQVWDNEKYTRIYFHGVCLKNEKKSEKTQNELKLLRQKIEELFVNELLIDK